MKLAPIVQILRPAFSDAIAAARDELCVEIATTPDQVLEVQQLRYRVYCEERGFERGPTALSKTPSIYIPSMCLYEAALPAQRWERSVSCFRQRKQGLRVSRWPVCARAMSSHRYLLPAPPRFRASRSRVTGPALAQLRLLSCGCA